MPFEHYIQSGGKRLRCGYTTGTCAALAAAGAARLLLGGRAPESVTLTTPGGLPVTAAPRLPHGRETAAARWKRTAATTSTRRTAR
ncbi:MAG: cobalt-precorrin-5B (C(1))-methyltransferase [Ruthenibacterium lactatiformans]